MTPPPDVTSIVAQLWAAPTSECAWTAEMSRQVLEAIMGELGAHAGASYWLARGETELLGAVPAGAELQAHLVLQWLVADECRLFSRALIADGEQGALAALAWPCAPDDQVALVLRFPPQREPSVEQLRRLGMLIALAAENAQLRRAREREARQNELLFRVSQAFMSTMDLSALPHLIVSLVTETMERAENCVLHLLDADNDLLVAMSASQSTRGSAQQLSPPLRRGIGAAGLALVTGQVVNIGDVTRDERFLPRPGAQHIASLLAAPLMVRAVPIGTLTVNSGIPYAFGEEDERLLMTLASLAAAAIDNADLVESLRQSLEELRQTQAQLLQVEKLSALAQLVAGITHEINNPLAAISGYAQLLAMNDSLDEQGRHDVARIYEQSQRAARIVRNLLTFAREHRAMQRPIDVNVLLQSTLETVSHQLRAQNIVVDLQLAPQALRVIGDPFQLQQVFLNLIDNARDAMVTAHGGGRLTVISELEGALVRVRLRDTGPGIPPEVAPHLFEPFFTTKEVGKGTGLGLSICFGIVGEHGGRIYLAESRAPGAEFVVELPHTTQSPAEDEASYLAHLPHPTNRLVLVVEDEEPVARVVQRVLSQDGHQAIVTHDGREVLSYLKLAKERGVPFDLVISDIKMPQISGSELYEDIVQELPEMAERVLFMADESISAATRAFLSEHGLPFLIKPFDLEELRQAISESLG